MLGGSFDLTAEENQVYLFMGRRTLHKPNLPSSNPNLRDIPTSSTRITSLNHPPNHQVIFGAILFARPRSSSASVIKKMRGLKAVTDTDLEMWDFTEEYEDMKHTTTLWTASRGTTRKRRSAEVDQDRQGRTNPWFCCSGLT